MYVYYIYLLWNLYRQSSDATMSSNKMYLVFAFRPLTRYLIWGNICLQTIFEYLFFFQQEHKNIIKKIMCTQNIIICKRVYYVKKVYRICKQHFTGYYTVRHTIINISYYYIKILNTKSYKIYMLPIYYYVSVLSKTYITWLILYRLHIYTRD